MQALLDGVRPRSVWPRVATLLFVLGAMAAGPALAGVASAQVATAPGQRSPAGHAVINALLQSQIVQAEQGARHLQRDRRDPMITVEVTSTRDIAGIIRSLGGTVRADIGGTVTAARLPASRVAELARQPGVLTLYPNQKMSPTLDQSVPEIRANQVWNLTTDSGLPIQGNHVLVGVVDSGIDYHNPDFKNPDGSTRIKFIWDQSQDGNPPSGFSFGTECDSASINSGQCPEKDTDGHGTHVAGVAAGNGLSSNPPKEIGVAPQADIIVVKCDLSVDNILAAWQYLVNKAQQLGEPIAINNSFGGQFGPHDGNEDEDLALDKLAGPGRIFVASAGNDGHKGVHTDGSVAQGGTAQLPLHAYGSESKVSFGLFYSARDSLAVTLTNTATGESFGPVNPGDKIDGQASQDGDTKVTIVSGDWSSSYRFAYVTLKTASGNPIKGDYALSLSGTTVGDSGRYDAWMTTESAAGFTSADEADTLGIPADARSVITVGNYATRVAWTDMNNQQHNACDFYYCIDNVLNVGDIKPSSSEGPTADGRQKPDIGAPGTMIISSLSHDAAICSSSSQSDCIDPSLITPDGLNYAESGTSMSSPHIAGVAALMLEVSPSLDQSTATSILRSTARHDQFTGSDPWTPTFGAGKVDAYAAVQAVMASAAVPFSVASVSVESANSKPNESRPSLVTVKAGKAYLLSTYVQFSADLADNTQAAIQWTVQRVSGGGAKTYSETVTASRAQDAGKVVRASMRWTAPKKTGALTITGKVTINGHSDNKFVTIVVRR